MRPMHHPIMSPVGPPVMGPLASPTPLPGEHRIAFGYDRLGRVIGNTTHSNSRVSVATLIDHEGVLRTAKSGETRIEGARRVSNLATALTTHSVTVVSGRKYQLSTTGANGSTVVLSNAATGTLTNDGVNQIGFDTAKTAGSTTLTLTITGTLTGLLVEDVTGQANTAPSDIIAHDTDHGWGANGVAYYDYENGNTISGGVVTNARGSDITGNSVLAEPDATNAVVNNMFTERTGDDFDDWTEVPGGSSTVTADTSDVPPGFDVCCRLDTDGLNNNVYIYQTSRLNIGEGGIATFSAWIKANAADGMKFSIKADDGAGGSEQNLSADGTAWEDSFVEFLPSDLPTTWERYQFTLPPTNAGRTHVYVYAVARRLGANATRRITGIQLENKEAATSLIPTTTASATRDKDGIQFSDASSWFPVFEGVSILKLTPQLDWATNSAFTYWLTAAPSGNLVAYRNGLNDGVRAYDGTNVPTIFAGHTPGTPITIATIWSTPLNKFQVGYYKHQEATWHWDPTPTAYAGFTPTILSLIQSLSDVEKVDGVKIYSGLPESTLAATQTWIENNAPQLLAA